MSESVQYHVYGICWPVIRLNGASEPLPTAPKALPAQQDVFKDVYMPALGKPGFATENIMYVRFMWGSIGEHSDPTWSHRQLGLVTPQNGLRKRKDIAK